MDPRRFDALARSLAVPKTRRGFLEGLAALAGGVVGSRAAVAPGHAGPMRQQGLRA
jgi:hypothetical protein